jgi:hypothetical protein
MDKLEAMPAKIFPKEVDNEKNLFPQLGSNQLKPFVHLTTPTVTPPLT